MAKKGPPSRHQVRSGARHVDYEVDSLMWTATYLKNPSAHGATHDAVVRQAILDSWCIHLRSLIEFFHPTRSDTLRATDYVQDIGLWTRTCPRLSVRERRRLKALHELVAHISIGRHSAKSNWNERDHEIARRRLAPFFAHIAPRRRAWFPNGVRWYEDGGTLPGSSG
jgi:hypothetical protein